MNRKTQCTKLFRPMRRQDHAVAPDFQPGEAPLHQVYAARHRGKVNAFGRGATLDVGDVGLENLLEEFQRSMSIRSGEHPGMHNAAQRRTVRRPGHVVVHHLGDLVGPEVVVESIE